MARRNTDFFDVKRGAKAVVLNGIPFRISKSKIEQKKPGNIWTENRVAWRDKARGLMLDRVTVKGGEVVITDFKLDTKAYEFSGDDYRKHYLVSAGVRVELDPKLGGVSLTLRDGYISMTYSDTAKSISPAMERLDRMRMLPRWYDFQPAKNKGKVNIDEQPYSLSVEAVARLHFIREGDIIKFTTINRKQDVDLSTVDEMPFMDKAIVSRGLSKDVHPDRPLVEFSGEILTVNKVCLRDLSRDVERLPERIIERIGGVI